MTPKVQLSPRERDVVAYFAQGLTYSQIGRRMGIRVCTVDTYLRRVRAKTGAGSGADLVRLALRMGVAPGDPAAE